MNIDYTVTALMFPAIPLLMSVYGNRFHTLSDLIRKIHDEYVWEKHIPPEWEKQLINLNGRVKWLRLKPKNNQSQKPKSRQKQTILNK